MLIIQKQCLQKSNKLNTLSYLLCFNVNCAFVVRTFNVKHKSYVFNSVDLKLGVPVSNKHEPKMLTLIVKLTNRAIALKVVVQYNKV